MSKKKEEPVKMIGYKAFNKDWKCNDLQYKVGQTQEHSGAIKLCSTGLHFCENPLDVLNYYDLTNSHIALVEAEGVSDETKKEDSKRVAQKLTVKAEVDLPAFVKASVEFVWNLCKQEKDKKAAKESVSDDDSSKLAASGYYSQLAASGYSSKLAASGYSSQLAASGYSSKLAASGDSSKLAASGYYSKLAASGDYSKLAASGYSSKLAASGYYSQLAASGKDSIAAGIGVNNTAKATKGSWIVLAEWVDGKPKYVKSVQVDGKKIKADTWYRLSGGKFVEVK